VGWREQPSLVGQAKDKLYLAEESIKEAKGSRFALTPREHRPTAPAAGKPAGILGNWISFDDLRLRNRSAFESVGGDLAGFPPDHTESIIQNFHTQEKCQLSLFCSLVTMLCVVTPLRSAPRSQELQIPQNETTMMTE
jgi:hypothetical protein